MGRMEQRRFSFPKSARVRKKADIDRVFREGARYSCKGMRLHSLKTSLSETRVVFIPVRAFDGAVERNRARRLAREAWRLSRGEVPDGFDLAFVLYPGWNTLRECSSMIALLLRKAGMSK